MENIPLLMFSDESNVSVLVTGLARIQPGLPHFLFVCLSVRKEERSYSRDE